MDTSAGPSKVVASAPASSAGPESLRGTPRGPACASGHAFLPPGFAASLRRHALAWLLFSNLVGVLLAVLLLHPQLGSLLGPLGYGRWMPLHMNGHLYGWCSLPLIGVLFAAFWPASAGAGEGTARWALRGWSLALALGCLSWLLGITSGKLFIDWHGWARPLLPLAMLGLWVLAAGWEEQRGALLAPGSEASLFHHFLRLGLLAGLFVVPWAFHWAAGREVFPAVNPDTGGATGGSLLVSTLGILLVYGLVPLLLRLPSSTGSTPESAGAELAPARLSSPQASSAPWRLRVFLLRPAFLLYWTALAAALVVFALTGHGNRSHHEPSQIVSLGLLLAWVPLSWFYFRAFAWPSAARPWLLAAWLWWLLLVCTGWLSFLPGFSENLKFTHGLVAHAHVALAGLVFSASWAFLLTLAPVARPPSRATYLTWHLALAAHVVILWILGYRETADPSGFFLGAPWLKLLYSLRLLAGLALAWVSLVWLKVARNE